MLTAIWMAAAIAQDTTPVDVTQAVALGMPRLHQPFTDCQCVAMTWTSGEQTLVLELPREQIKHFEHKAAADGPHQLSIATHSGEQIILEQAPCIFVARQITEYTYLLNLPATVIDETGEPFVATCKDPLQKVDEWEGKRQKTWMEKTTPSMQGKNSKLELISAKGESSIVLGVRASLASVRPNAGACFEKGVMQGTPQMTFNVSTREGAAPRIKTGSVGVEAVDACFVELAQAVTLPDGKSKVRMTYSPME